MSFLIFAAALKYLSNVDQVYQWYILTRERYLAVWIVLLAMAGFYLLGMLRIGDEESGSVGAGRLGLGGLFLVLAVSLIPGMFGARLGELDAYVPSPEYSGLTNVGFGGGAEANKWIKDDYAKALELARESGKPVLIGFTGYTCTNCHWMKANMFTRPPIAEALAGLILVELYTDGADERSQANQQMQLDRFGTVAIPYYAIIRPDESVIAEFPGRTRDTEEFLQFLHFGRDHSAHRRWWQGRGPLSASQISIHPSFLWDFRNAGNVMYAAGVGILCQGRSGEAIQARPFRRSRRSEKQHLHTAIQPSTAHPRMTRAQRGYRWLALKCRAVFRENASPSRTAIGFAVGSFIGVFPQLLDRVAAGVFPGKPLWLE